MEQKKEKSFERRQELIDAALEEFSERGYEQASLNNILKEAQISKGTFYYHFENKEELYLYLIGILIDEKKKFLTAATQPEDYQKDIFTLFKVLARAGIEFARHNPRISKFSESYLKESGSDIYKKSLERYNFVRNDYFSFLVENAYRNGDIRIDIPKEFAARIISYLFTNMHSILNATKVEDYENTFDYMMDFLKDGLGRKV